MKKIGKFTPTFSNSWGKNKIELEGTELKVDLSGKGHEKKEEVLKGPWKRKIGIMNKKKVITGQRSI